VAAGAEGPRGGFLFSVNLIFVAQIANYGLRFLLGIILARALGPELRGDYALFVLSASLAASAATLGAGLGSMYHLGKSRLSLRVLLGNSQFLALVTGALALAVVTAIALTVDTEKFVRDDAFWLYLLALPAALEFTLLTALLVGQGRFTGLNSASLSQSAFVLLGAGALYAADELTLFRVLAVWSGSYLLGSAVALAFLGFQNWSLRAALRPDLPALRLQVQTGLPGQAGNLLQFLNYRLDQFLVAGLATRADVGIYAVAVGLSETVWWIANAVALALLPRLTRMEADRAAEVAAVACRNTLLVAATAAAGLAAASLVLVEPVFGAAFSDATQAVFWLMPGVVALSGAKVLSSYLFSQGKMAITSLFAMIALAGTLLFDLLLIPPFGIFGAAAASSIAYTTSAALTLAYFARFTSSNPFDCLLVRPADLQLYLDAARRVRQRIFGGPTVAGHDGAG
jgi:O-antigen/teichoic acid export membrane protein